MFEQEYFNEHAGNMSAVDVDLAFKINELVKAVKQLDKNIKDKEYCENCGVKLTEKNKYMNGLCMECKCGELQKEDGRII